MAGALITGIILIVVTVFIIMAAVGGLVAQSGGDKPSDSTDACDGCKQSDVWWDGLSWWEKVLFSAYYAIRKLACLAYGCK